VSKICRDQRSFGRAATSNGAPVLIADAAPTVIDRFVGPCMTWAISFRGDREIFILCTLSMSARNVAGHSTPMFRIWLRPVVIIRTVSSVWPCGWWWRTDCRIERPVGISGATIACLFPTPQSRTGLRPGGKKAEPHIAADYLDWALEDFSGYVAADELYDGPYCVLSLVDNRTFKRIMYEVLDHSPKQTDIAAFFTRFRAALQVRGQTLHGITTDGSNLYPGPISEVFGAVPHQICEFHVIAELTKAVLRAVAKLRKELAAKIPKLPRGRPSSKAAKRAARTKKRAADKITDLFDHRYLFVQHDLTPTEQKTLVRISRGQPQLRALRQIMDEVYRLFDRRCRTDTAWAKLAKLRQRVRRFKRLGKTLDKLFSPNLDKALTFLDDKLLPSTSNAVERGNRRHRKMQKTVYRVRNKDQLHARIALDMVREEHAASRSETVKTLHHARAG
jgi:Transposase